MLHIANANPSASTTIHYIRKCPDRVQCTARSKGHGGQPFGWQRVQAPTSESLPSCSFEVRRGGACCCNKRCIEASLPIRLALRSLYSDSCKVSSAVSFIAVQVAESCAKTTSKRLLLHTYQMRLESFVQEHSSPLAGHGRQIDTVLLVSKIYVASRRWPFDAPRGVRRALSLITSMPVTQSRGASKHRHTQQHEDSSKLQ